MSVNSGPLGPSLVDRFQCALDAVEGLRDLGPPRPGGASASFPQAKPQVSFAPLGVGGVLAPPPQPGGGHHLQPPHTFGPTHPGYGFAGGQAHPYAAPMGGACGAPIYGPPLQPAPRPPQAAAPAGAPLEGGEPPGSGEAGAAGRGFLAGIPAPLIAGIALAIAVGIFLLRRRILAFLQGARGKRALGAEDDPATADPSVISKDGQPQQRRRYGDGRRGAEESAPGQGALGRGLAGSEGTFAFQRRATGRGAEGPPAWDSAEEEAMRRFVVQQESALRAKGAEGKGAHAARRSVKGAPPAKGGGRGPGASAGAVPRKTVSFPPPPQYVDDGDTLDEDAEDAMPEEGGPEFFAEEDPLFAKL